MQIILTFFDCEIIFSRNMRLLFRAERITPYKKKQTRISRKLFDARVLWEVSSSSESAEVLVRVTENSGSEPQRASSFQNDCSRMISQRGSAEFCRGVTEHANYVTLFYYNPGTVFSYPAFKLLRNLWKNCFRHTWNKSNLRLAMSSNLFKFPRNTCQLSFHFLALP